MTTNLAIDDDLLVEAQKLSGLNKKNTVNTTLKEFFNHRKQLDIIELFGVMEPDADYDYKKLRRTKIKL